MVKRTAIGFIVAISATISISGQEIGYTYGAVGGTLHSVTIPSGFTDQISAGILPGGFESFAISPNGVVFTYSASTNSLYSIDTVTGTVVDLGTVSVGPNQLPAGLAFDGEGRLLMLANANPQSALYEIDTADATASFVLWIDSPEVTSFAISGGECFALGDMAHSLFSVDLSTGDVTELPGAFTGGIHDLSFDGTGQLWGIKSYRHPQGGCTANVLVRFDIVTGAHTEVSLLNGPTDECFIPLAIITDQPDSIPTLGLLGLTVFALIVGCLGLIFAIARRGIPA